MTDEIHEADGWRSEESLSSDSSLQIRGDNENEM